VRGALANLRREVLRVHARGKDHRTGFEQFDVAFTGEILDREFKQCLEAVGISLDAKQTRALCVHFAAASPGVAGRIRYRDILAQVATQDDQRQSNVAIQLFHDKCKRRATLANGSVDVEKVLQHFSGTNTQDSTALLSHIAFKKGLESLDLGLSDTQVRMLIDRFAVRSSGEGSCIRMADLREFILQADPGVQVDDDGTNDPAAFPTGSSRQTTEPNTKQEPFGGSLMQSFRRQVAGIVENGMSIRRAFERSDADLSGRVSNADFIFGVRSTGESVY
jgi:hypothetical protein